MALGLPVLLALLLQSVFALVDLAFVRQLGEAAVAGLSISLQVFFIVLAVSQVIAATVIARVSQAYGAGRLDEARTLFSTYAVIGVATGLVATVVALLGASAYVHAFTDDPAVYEQGLAYFRVNAYTFFFQLMLIVLGNAFRGSGDFTTPMRMMVVSVLLNLALDPLLIFGLGPFPELGIAGAALATVIAQAAACALYVVRLLRRSDPRGLHLRRPAFSRDTWREVLVRGLPAGAQFFLLSVVLGLVLAAMKPYGATWTATAGGGFRVLQQTMLPMLAVGTAAAAISGQNKGANQPERIALASRTALAWTLAYACVLTVALFFGGHVAGLLFIKSDSELPVAVDYFRVSAPTLVAAALTFVPTWVMQALGLAVLPLLAAVVRLVLLAVAVLWLIPALDLGPVWVFAAATLTAFVEGLIATGFLTATVRRMVRAAPASATAAAAADA